MPNQWNEIFDGLFTGGGQVVDKIMERNRLNSKHEQLTKEFGNFSNYLGQMVKGTQDQMNSLLNPPPPPPSDLVPKTAEGIEVNSPVGQMPPMPSVTTQPTTTAPSADDIYQRMLKKSLELNDKYGDSAKPYINAMDSLYKNFFKETPKPDIREGKDGEFWDLSDPTTPKRLTTAPPKELPKVSLMNKTQSQLSEMTDEQWKDLTTSEVNNAFNNYENLPTNIQDKFKEFYPTAYAKYVEDNTDKGSGNRSRRRNIGSFNYPVTGSSNDTFNQLKKYGGMTQDEIDADIDAQDNIEKLADKLGIYDRTEFNQLMSDAYNGSSKEVVSKIRQIEKGNQEFNTDIDDYDLSDLRGKLYGVETDPSINPDGVNQLYDLVVQAQSWANNYASTLSKGEANKMWALWDKLIDDVLQSKGLSKYNRGD